MPAIAPGKHCTLSTTTKLRPQDGSLEPPKAFDRKGPARHGRFAVLPEILVLLLLAVCIVPPGSAHNAAPATSGFSLDLPYEEADVIAVVQSVVDDHVIRGTYVYEREKTLNEAVAETSSSYFAALKEDGHVFYKVRRGALAPRNFKNSADIGEITVRYLVRGAASGRTHLEITAVFIEDGTHRMHPSNSTVETSELAEIQKQLLSLAKDRQQAAELREKRAFESEEIATLAKQSKAESSRYESAELSLRALEQRAAELEHAVEVRVPAANTELKSAPFQGAATLAKLAANSDVLVEILTPYWYGIETADGHRGWIRREQAVPLP